MFFNILQNASVYNAFTGFSSFTFNGKEKDDEWNGTTGGALDFGDRMLDARIGRWMSVDKKYSKYPYTSPYAAMGNNPIIYKDPNGDTLVVAGIQAVADILSLVKDQKSVHFAKIGESDMFYVTVDYTYDEMGGKGSIVPDQTQGLELLYLMSNAKEKYLYETNPDKIIYNDKTSTDCSNNGIVNISDQAYFQYDKMGNVKKDWKFDFDPEKGFNAEVIISETAEWYEGNGEPNKTTGQYPSDNSLKPRPAVVLHELAESYARTTLKLPYVYVDYKKFPDMKGNYNYIGKTGPNFWNSWEPKESDSMKDMGAHGWAKKYEMGLINHQTFTFPSNHPGTGALKKD